MATDGKPEGLKRKKSLEEQVFGAEPTSTAPKVNLGGFRGQPLLPGRQRTPVQRGPFATRLAAANERDAAAQAANADVDDSAGPLQDLAFQRGLHRDTNRREMATIQSQALTFSDRLKRSNERDAAAQAQQRADEQAIQDQFDNENQNFTLAEKRFAVTPREIQQDPARAAAARQTIVNNLSQGGSNAPSAGLRAGVTEVDTSNQGSVIGTGLREGEKAFLREREGIRRQQALAARQNQIESLARPGFDERLALRNAQVGAEELKIAQPKGRTLTIERPDLTEFNNLREGRLAQLKGLQDQQLQGQKDQAAGLRNRADNETAREKAKLDAVTEASKAQASAAQGLRKESLDRAKFREQKIQNLHTNLRDLFPASEDGGVPAARNLLANNAESLIDAGFSTGNILQYGEFLNKMSAAHKDATATFLGLIEGKGFSPQGLAEQVANIEAIANHSGDKPTKLTNGTSIQVTQQLQKDVRAFMSQGAFKNLRQLAGFKDDKG